MGCDIHLHIEFKHSGRWHHYGHPSIRRDYWLFEQMAGVRGYDQNAISSPKGIPNDCTELTSLYYENQKCDAHSESWLDVKEIDTLRKRLKDHPHKSWPETELEYGILHTHLPEEPFSKINGDECDEDDFPIEDIRFIFWFDN